MPGFETAIAEVKSAVHTDIAAAAKAEHAKIMGADPKPLGFVRHVDGVEGPEESVKDGGVIVYDYNRLDYAVETALDVLRQLSPVRKGDYVRSHTIFLNGQPVDDLKDWKDGDKVVIANTVPYARKIEVGGKQYRTHPHVYERAERQLQRQLGNVVDISFGYFEVHAGDIENWSARTISGRRGGSKVSVDAWLRRQPALFISPL